jgi:glycosyltransferase involved in cell wall biosynthesis
MTPPVLSIVVPAYNAHPVLTRCIESWRTYASGQPIELVVVEDGARDGARVYLADLQTTPWGRDHLRVLHEDDVHELICTNRGFEVARGSLLAAWQSDMFLTSRWLVPEILATFAAYPAIGLLNMSYGLDLAPFDAPIERWEDLYDSRRFRGSIGPAPWNWMRIQEVDAMIRPWVVRRACLDAAGPLDETFRPTEWDEPDLAFRIRRAGWKVCSHAYERGGAFQHLGSYTLSHTHATPEYRARALRNGLLFHERWADDIRAHHTRARAVWWRRGSLAGWAATATTAVTRACRRFLPGKRGR